LRLIRVCFGKLTKNELSLLSNSNIEWFCTKCLHDILPFQSITNNSFSKLFTLETNKICIVCNKRNINLSLTYCEIGKHYFHIACDNPDLKKSKNTQPKIYTCNHCNPLPFKNINSKILIQEAFNSNDFTDSFPNHDFYINKFKDFKDLPSISIANPLSSNEEMSYQDFSFYTPKSFKKKLKLLSGNELSLFHTNLRSYEKNCEALGHKFDIVAFSETWQSTTKPSSSKDLHGYHPYEQIEGTSQNSGCGLYIRENLNFKVRHDLSLSFTSNTEEFQILYIEIINKSGNIIVGVTYRHPRGALNEFLNHTKKILCKITKENKKHILLGDFNIDLLKSDRHAGTENFLDIMLSSYMVPHILGPTRINENGKFSLIDNIFYNCLDNNSVSGNLLCPITDHLPNFLLIPIENLSRLPQQKFKRDLKSLNLESFKEDLMQKNLLERVKKTNDVNTAYNILHDELIETLNRHIPLRPLKKIRKKTT